MGVSSALALVALLVVARSTAQGPQKYFCDSLCSRNKLPCPSPCRQCPKIPPCPAPVCPHPECPHISSLPRCPDPVCASVPTIPACPTPLVKLSCPHLACPQRTCAACSRCPDVLPCPVCPTFLPPTTVMEATLQGNAIASNVTESIGAISAGTAPYPGGYEVTPGIGIHKMSVMKQNWVEANRTCSRDGAYLVILNSKAEKDLMLRKMRGEGINILHVGFHSEMNERFVTVLGETMDADQQSLWATREPSGGPTYNCTYLSLANSAILTERCADREYFACEKPMS